MNDELMDMIRISCDECVCDDDAARIEHERAIREREERERKDNWASLEYQFGRLYTNDDWFREGTCK